jgi:Putative MetA-pathway of phenol degradation
VGLNLYGSPARRMPEFAIAGQARLNVGASLMIVAPTGQYDPQRIVNLGNNRWAFKPEAAIIRNVGPWMFEIYGGAWLFTDNDNYVNGQTRSQKPLASAQFSLRRTFRPGLWVSANINYYTGGRTNVGGLFQQDFQSNSRAGTTLAVPLSRRNAVRIAVSKGAYTTIGADFLGLSASFQQLF